MVSKHPIDGSDGELPRSQNARDSAVSETEDSAFDRLLHEAARVIPSGRRLAPGTRLCEGRFEILRRIGEGGMGVVYEALDSARREKVALKTLSRLEAGDVYRLKNEFRALADVSHPNLVGLHELFADEGLWFFSMDLIDGECFDQWVRPEGARDEARLRAALPQLLHAVIAIHGAGKLHRDLKPSNVLVTPKGRVVVLDFGLAVDPEIGGVGQTVADQSVSGTPGYMAPEQAGGHAAKAASDVYAIGVMVFEALAGRLPFEGRAMEMLLQKQTAEAPSLTECWPDAASDLAALCATTLRIAPSERPSAAALLERLGAQGEAIQAARTASSLAPEAAAELFGREAELEALHAAHRAACDGDKPVVVLMSGQSGIGKSALLETFLDALRREGRAVLLSGRCYERESVPFKGFDALVDELSRYLRRQSAIEAAGLAPREASALRRLFPVPMVTLACHRRDARVAWALCTANDARLRASFAARVPHQAITWQFLRGMVAAQLASETTDATERRTLIDEAERMPRIGRTRPRAGTLLLLRAAAACARRDRERAVRLLREFEAVPRPPAVGPSTVHAVRRRLGVLLGGDEGKALVSGADAFFRQCGAIDPEHYVATCLPGLDIR